jgi:L-lactate dehydrogenase (cytochrome)
MNTTQSNQRTGLVQFLLDMLHSRAEKKWASEVADALTTDDLWRILERRVPRIVNEYFRGGADDEVTLRESVMAFRQARTTAWGARKFDSLNLATTVAGHKLQVPWFVAPVGSLRSLWPKADAVASKVAGEFGTVMALSTLSGTPMEEVSAASSGDCWFQLYLCGGREASLRGIERAKKAGFTALILTIDTGQAGNRAAHARMKPMTAASSLRGLSFGERLEVLSAKTKLSPQMLPRLSWLFSHWADGGLMEFVNVQMDEAGTPMPYTDIGKQLAESAVTWDDLDWVREAWGDKPLIVKGVHNADDAKLAEDKGATGVIWSNHGGRQEDRVPPTLHIVAEEMPKMANSKLDFMMDGGIRRGKDVLIGLSYGLKAVGLGRVTAAGLGAGGQAGLQRAFQIMKSELERSMTLVGVKTVQEIHENGPEIRRDNRIIGDAHLPPIAF